MKRYLAFDLGASSGRALLGTLIDGRLSLREIHRFENVPVKVGNILYWDMLGIFREIKTGLLAYAESHSDPLSGIGIDSWGVDYGLLDKHNEMLGNPVHYRDDQTDGMIEQAARDPGRDFIYGQTGIAFMKFNTLYQLMGMQKRDATAYVQAEKLLFVPDLLGWMLTGKMATEYTIASTAQLLDVHSRDWAWPLIDRLNLPRKLFGPIHPPGVKLGALLPEVAADCAMAPVPVFSVAGHDTGSAVVAVPGEGDDFAYLSSGTWSLMGIESPTPVVSSQAIGWNFTNEGGVFDTYRILRNIMGLWITQQCRQHWRRQGQELSFSDMTREAEAAPTFMAVIDPDDDLFFSPGEMPERVQDYCRNTGQAVPQTVGEITRVVLESLALRYRWCMQKLEILRGRPLTRLHVVGGGTQNELLCQLTADAMNRPVIAGPVEATAIGNLLMQAVGDGAIGSLEEARAVVRASFAPVTYEPRLDPAWDAQYEKFLALIGEI